MNVLVVLLAFLLGVNLTQVPESTPEPTSSIPKGSEIPMQYGAAVVLYGNDTTMEVNTIGFFNDLDARGLGINSLIFTFPIFQDGPWATMLYEDLGLTPSVENIRIFIREAHARGYSVWIKPLIDDGRLNGRWRGSIEPGGSLTNIPALDAWFTSYGALILQYAQLAQEEQAIGIVIGTEMVSLDKDMPKYNDRWNALITAVRSVYDGNVAYAKNWSPLELPGFASSLDVMMIDAFFDMQSLNDDASVEDIRAGWEDWSPYLLSYRATLDIPIMFAEVGIVPRVGSFRTPWNSNNGNRPDYEAQRRYYEATCDFVQDFGLQGNYWWAIGFYDFFENQEGRLTYNFYDVPAENEVRSCYARG